MENQIWRVYLRLHLKLNDAKCQLSDQNLSVPICEITNNSGYPATGPPAKAIKEDKAVSLKRLGQEHCRWVILNGFVLHETGFKIGLIHKVSLPTIHNQPTIPTELAQKEIKIN
jgi:hypothetical protein